MDFVQIKSLVHVFWVWSAVEEVHGGGLDGSWKILIVTLYESGKGPFWGLFRRSRMLLSYIWKDWAVLIRCCRSYCPSFLDSWLLCPSISTWFLQIFNNLSFYSLFSSLLKWWALTINSCHRLGISLRHHHQFPLCHIFRTNSAIAFCWSCHRFPSWLTKVTLLCWVLRQVHELNFISFRYLTQLVNIIVEVEKSLINLHLFFLLLFLQL